MKVGINALCAENRSGTGRYATQLLRALARTDSEGSYVVAARVGSPLRDMLRPFANFHVEGVVDRGALRGHLYERRRLGDWIARQGLDVFHGPAFVVPPNCPVPSVVTIHDLVYHLFPGTVRWSRRRHYRRAIPRSARQAACVLVDSESVGEDLRTHLGVSPTNVIVAPLGVGQRFFASGQGTAELAVARRYRLPDRFMLTVGTLEPRKDLPTLVCAYARLASDWPEAPDLVIVGRGGWGMRGLNRLVSQLGVGDRVRRIGFVADEDLPAVYRRADLFVCTSIYEGFGLPVLEAMASGTPVVCSDTPSFAQVLGDTGMLVRPGGVEAFARAMADALTDPTSTTHRAGRARQRARQFTWAACARRTLTAYRTARGSS